MIVEEADDKDLFESLTEDGTDSNQEEDALDETERQFLKCLLNSEAYENILQSSGLSISILVDAINEKLFDMLCDTAIIFDGDKPTLVEDYIDELKGMVEA